MRVWPYVPQHGLSESLEWLTDVIRCKAGEERVALRHLPRQTHMMECWLSPEEYGAAKLFARSKEDTFLLPLWQHLVDVPDLTLGDDFLPGTFDPRFFSGLALVWQSNSVWAVVETTAESGGLRLSAPLGRAYFRPCVLPLQEVFWAQAPDFTLSNNDVKRAEIRVQSVWGTQLTSSKVRPMYRGLQVLDDPNVLVSQIREEHWHEKDEVDSQSGLFTHFNAYAQASGKGTMSWNPIDRPELMEALEWVHTRQGKRWPFWYRSHNSDFGVRGPLEPHPTLSTKGRLTVALVPDLTEAVPFDIMIERKNGETRFARVESVEFISDQVRGLVLGTRFSTTWAQNDIGRVSFLLGVRFDSDRIEIKHRTGGSATISVPIVEVPNL